MRRERIETIRWTLRGALALFLLFAAFVINGNILTIRLQDLDNLLSSASMTDSVSTTEILGRYQLMIQRFEEGTESLEAFETEIQLATLSNHESNVAANDETSSPTHRKSFERALLILLRRAIGKPTVVIAEPSETTSTVREAYMLERQRRWDDAVRTYRKVLETDDLNDEMTAKLRIHLGFCLSMTGDYTAARNEYETVLDTYRGTEFAITAVALIDSIKSIEGFVTMETPDTAGAEVDDPLLGALPDESEDPAAQHNRITAARQAYLEARYDDAIVAVDSVLETNRNDPPSPRIEIPARYYRGRSLEEVGDYSEALDEYRIISGLIEAERHSNRSEDRLNSLHLEEWVARILRRQAFIRTFYVDDTHASTARPAVNTTAIQRDVSEDPYIAIIQQYSASVPNTVRTPPEENTESSPPAKTQTESSSGLPRRSPTESRPDTPVLRLSASSVDSSSRLATRTEPESPAASRFDPQERTTEGNLHTTSRRPVNPTIEYERTVTNDSGGIDQVGIPDEHSRGEPLFGGPNRSATGDSTNTPQIIDEIAVHDENNDPKQPPPSLPNDRLGDTHGGSQEQDPSHDSDFSGTSDRNRSETTEIASQRTSSGQHRIIDPASIVPPATYETFPGENDRDTDDERRNEDTRTRIRPTRREVGAEQRRFVGNVIRVEDNGTILVLMENDTRLGENEELVLYRETTDGRRIILGIARPIGRIPPRLIARIQAQITEHSVQQGDWAYVIGR